MVVVYDILLKLQSLGTIPPCPPACPRPPPIATLFHGEGVVDVVRSPRVERFLCYHLVGTDIAVLKALFHYIRYDVCTRVTFQLAAAYPVQTEKVTDMSSRYFWAGEISDIGAPSQRCRNIFYAWQMVALSV